MNYEVGDRVKYSIHASNDPGGAAGSMAVDMALFGTVKKVVPVSRQVQVAFECAPPVGIVTTMVKQNDPALSKVQG